MTHDQTTSHWTRVLQVLTAFGEFSCITEVHVEFVASYAQAGAVVRYDSVRLWVPEDWETSVLARGLTSVPGSFPLAAEPLDSGRPDVSLFRCRHLIFGCLLRQREPGGPWFHTGERLLRYHRGDAEECLIARTICGTGQSFHKTSAGAIIRAVRARGRERARSAKLAASLLASSA